MYAFKLLTSLAVFKKTVFDFSGTSITETVIKSPSQVCCTKILNLIK